MTAIVITEIIQLFAAYLFITVLVPHWVLGKTLQFKNRYEKFMLYTMIGNFYIINVVYLLELLHISYPITLFLFTLVPCLVAKIKLEHIQVRELLHEKVDTFRRLCEGQLKPRAFADSRKPAWRDRLKRVGTHLKKIYVEQLVDVLLILLLLVAIFWIFGVTHLEDYGYKASDLIVHNYWINAMSENDIFVTGVYPYGFHCIVYYLHAVFHFETYVVLRLMALVETVWDILMILCFLKLICKAKYIPYVGPFVFALANFFRYNTYSRYCASLPQEYGIMFILPSIYCGFMYFRQQRREIHGLATKRSRIYLVGFAISFALTVTVHFYGTMIASFYCIAMAIGFGGWFFKKPYFKKVMLTVLVSVVVAILPMGIAVAFGTPLQGSLAWGLSVITGKSMSEEPVEDSASITVEDDQSALEQQEYEQGRREGFNEKYGRVLGPVAYKLEMCRSAIANSVVLVDEENRGNLNYILWLVPILLVCGGLCFKHPARDWIYGAILISTAIYHMFMIILVSVYDLGLPALMDNNRSSVYFAYSLGLVISLALDGILYLTVDRVKVKGCLEIVSLAIVVVCLFGMWKNGLIRERCKVGGMEMNASVECLTNIIREEKDFHWTIVSANDENRMASDRGYHYETINFLWDMEYIGPVGRVSIPTESVYIFIEKIPADYFVSYEGSGQSVSEQGCEHALASNKSLGCYQGKNRWVTMSRIYYWAQKFRELYPNEMSVYYESDEFVCYKIVQNPYRLFNFAIDYDFNTRSYPKEAEEE